MDILSTFHSDSLIVACASGAAREPVSQLVAELTLQGPLTILDGGNRFQPYRVAHLLRQKTADVNSIAKRIFIRRAFTCYQMLALLEDTPAFRQPYIILDFLATFYDDHVPAHEARRLLDCCLAQIEGLRAFAPVLITLAPPIVPERAFLIEMVCARADQVLLQETPTPAETQLSLFASHLPLTTSH